MSTHHIVPGDEIQWLSQGAFFFDKPRFVKNVVYSESRGMTYILVEDGPTGIPFDEIQITTRCRDHYGDGIWRCPECQSGWDAGILFKHQIPIPCNCPKCHEKLVFEKAI